MATFEFLDRWLIALGAGADAWLVDRLRKRDRRQQKAIYAAIDALRDLQREICDEGAKGRDADIRNVPVLLRLFAIRHMLEDGRRVRLARWFRREGRS
ncbi:MAG: hypothetical protein WA975_21550 [Mesorhizobium sp.]